MVGDVSKFYRIPASTQLNVPPGMTRRQAWDAAVRDADLSFSKQMHNICCNNCHHHSADALRRMGLDMTMFKAWSLVTFRGTYVSWGQVARVYIPFLVLVGIILAIVFGTR